MKTLIASQTGATRPRYFKGRLLSSEDLELEQQYIDTRLSLLARAAFGVGVVEGLVVSASESTLAISPGLAVDPLGRLLVLGEPCTASLPAAQGDWNVFVELHHEPCDVVPTLGLDENPAQEASTLRETIRIWLVQEAAPDCAREGVAVWLAHVRAMRGAIEVQGPKSRTTVARGPWERWIRSPK